MSAIKKLIRRKWLLCPLCGVLLITALSLSFHFTNDSRQFRQLTNQLFVSGLSGDALSLHYTLAYPENYGFTHTDAVLPVYNEMNSAQTEAIEIEEALHALSSISKHHLNEKDRYTYDLLMRYLNRQLKGAAFTFYAEPLSPASGMQAGLPILLADYAFRRVEDVEIYLKLLEQTDAYLEGLVAFENQKAQQGLFMPSYSASKVIEQCDTIMDKKSLNDETHFLYITFQERLAELEKQGILSSAQVEKFKSENKRLLTTVVQPAYEKTADAFIVLEEKGTNNMGLYYYPDGKSYYAYLLSFATGSDRSIAEIKQLLFKDYQENYEAILQLIQENPQLVSLTSDKLSVLPLESPSAMLADLQAEMSTDFPAFPASSTPEGSFLPSCTVKRVSSCMEDYCSPAYYLTPPIDDMSQNIIYINHKNFPDSLNLYTTLAHEGYPGHLYQTVYSQLYMNSQKENPIRSLLHYGGYVEGWALYVENLSYYYAQARIKASHPEVVPYYEYCRRNRNLHLCLYSLLDIAIHYEGATPMQVQKILQSVGIHDMQTVNSIYEYIIETPANYLKYYLGFLEFQILKEEAQKLWASDYTNYRFHKFILETGPSDFIGLHERLANDALPKLS